MGPRHVRITLKLFHEKTRFKKSTTALRISRSTFVTIRYFYFDFKFTNQMSKGEDAFDSTHFAFICSKGELEKSEVS